MSSVQSHVETSPATPPARPAVDPAARSALAGAWRQALSPFGATRTDEARVTLFEQQAEAILSLLARGTLDAAAAESNGAALARAGYLRREALLRTQQLLFEQLPMLSGGPERLPQAAMLLAAYWSHFTIGHGEAHRDSVVSHQEQVRRSMQEALQQRSQTLQRRAELSEMVLEMIQATTSSEMPLSEVVELMARRLELSAVVLYQAREDGLGATLVAQSGLEDSGSWRLVNPTDQTLPGSVWRNNVPQRASQMPSLPVPGLPATREASLQEQEALVLPLRTKTGTIGLAVAVLLPGAVLDDDLFLTLQLISHQLAHTLETQSLLESAREQLQELQGAYGSYIQDHWQNTVLAQTGFRARAEEIEVLESPPTGSVVVPLQVRGETIGRITVDLPDNTLDNDDLALVDAVADQMAQALETARLFQQTRRQSSQLEAAAEVGRAASSLLALDELLNTTVNLVRRTFGYYHAQVFLVDEDGRTAVLRASTGDIGRLLLERGHKLPVGSLSVIGRVTASGEPLVARDTDRDGIHRRNELLPNTRAELAVPLRYGSRIIGALDVQSTEPDVFSPEDIAVLTVLSDQLAIAIENARAYEDQLQTAEKLREVDRVKTQFLANMSHELRTPLNSIIGFSRVILKGIDGPVTDLQQKDLTTIYNAGQHLLGLIDDILDISKIEAGKMEMDFDNVDIRQVVDGVIATATGLVKGRPVQLRKEIPEDLPKIRADATRIRQVLLNLFSNASKFTEEGEIRCTITRIGEMIQLSVSDTGLGIPPDKIQNLFQAFYQVDSSPTRKVGGTGLGLAISRHFVDMHGGEIWAESTGIPGQGTIFSFTLPIHGPQEKSVVPTPEVAPVVLAVDEEPAITNMYAKYLETEGYRLVAIHDGLRVVDAAIQHRPSAILLDLRLSSRDGWQVLSDLKRHVATRDIPVIISSIEREDGGRLREAGASEHLMKPILRNDLLAALTRANGTQTVM